MINPILFPEVEAAFCSLVRDERALREQHKTIVSICDAELFDLTLIINDESSSDELLSDTYDQIKVVREQRSNSLLQISRTPKKLEDSDVVALKQRLRQDFLKICQMPRVIDASVDHRNNVSFVIHATCVHEGYEFFIGDWKVTFGNLESEHSYRLSSVKSGVKPTWRRDKEIADYPDYTLPDGGFCVGTNELPLESLFLGRQYAQAIQLLTYVLCHVNQEDTHNIPNAFNLDQNSLHGGDSWPPLKFGTTKSISLERVVSAHMCS